MIALRLVMPSTGDMELVEQAGGTIDLVPIFYDGDCMGPHLQVVELNKNAEGALTVTKIVKRYRIVMKQDGEIKLKKGQ
jgi:hypothetical protein